MTQMLAFEDKGIKTVFMTICYMFKELNNGIGNKTKTEIELIEMRTTTS